VVVVEVYKQTAALVVLAEVEAEPSMLLVVLVQQVTHLQLLHLKAMLVEIVVLPLLLVVEAVEVLEPQELMEHQAAITAERVEQVLLTRLAVLLYFIQVAVVVEQVQQVAAA
jgi:hypothetical protein